MAENVIDQMTKSVMHQLSRRGFLKSVGILGISIAGALSGLSGVKLAAAYCPGECFGPCNSCNSQCTSGGLTCICVCGGCNCTPRKVYAYGSWSGNPCTFDCACVACG